MQPTKLYNPKDYNEITCPICGFEIGTDDCTCGGLMHILPNSESRMDYLLFKIPTKKRER